MLSDNGAFLCIAYSFSEVTSTERWELFFIEL